MKNVTGVVVEKETGKIDAIETRITRKTGFEHASTHSETSVNGHLNMPVNLFMAVIRKSPIHVK